jgi:Ca2+-binding RTX toxin-like protein
MGTIRTVANNLSRRGVVYPSTTYSEDPMPRTTILTTAAALAGLAAAALAPVLSAAPACAATTCDGKVATIVAPEPTSFPVPPVQGTAGDDVIVGSAKDDVLLGGGGNDTICGFGGADRIEGGTGDDRLFGGLDSWDYEDYDGDHVVPGPGDDHVDLGHDPVTEELSWGTYTWDQVSYADATGPVSVDLTAGTATGEGADTIAPIQLVGGVEGSAYDDHLVGSEQIDWITAGGGDDVVDGRGGADFVQADAPTRRLPERDERVPGDDVVDGGDGDDEVEGGHGVDLLRGNAGRDAIRIQDGERGTRALGGPGRDGIGSWSFQSTGKALMLGGAGDDVFHPAIKDRRDAVVVRGGGGAYRLAPAASLRAAPHRSKVVIDASVGTVTTRIGTRVRFSSVTSFGFDGSTETRLHFRGSNRSEVLELTEQYGPVRAIGGGGDDRLSGGWGRDLLDGGPGRDALDGDKGRDRCLRGERLKACEVRR